MMPIEVLKPRVDPAVVEFLESALDKAKSGEVSGIVLVERTATDLIYSSVGIPDRWLAVGVLTHAIHKLLH